jgi:hypothetical protein
MIFSLILPVHQAVDLLLMCQLGGTNFDVFGFVDKS